MQSIVAIKGFLLDMDGLLLDTEKVSYRCWAETEAETGFQMPPGFYFTLIGQSMRRIGDRLREVMEPDCDVDLFLETASRIYTSSLMEAPVPVKRGAPEFLEALRNLEIPFCLATSTHRELCTHKLASSGLASFISLSVCGDEVFQSKPAPDIYLEAAKQTGFSPGELLVLEDSENGIRAGLEAGCFVAHVPDIAPVSLDWQARADRVYRSLEDVKAALERGEISIDKGSTSGATPRGGR